MKNKGKWEILFQRPIWIGGLIKYKEEVECQETKIGKVHFHYGRYRIPLTERNAKTGKEIKRDLGGAAMEGGFTWNGKNPCDPQPQQPATEYFWVQTINTNDPLAGKGPGDYVDADDPIDDPAYPYVSPGKNQDGVAFTGRSYYDAPRRTQHATKAITWRGTNMLACRVRGEYRKINVIGGFTWGFTLNPGDPADGALDVKLDAPGAWGWQPGWLPVLWETRGTRYRRGWHVWSGCCCDKKVFGPPYHQNPWGNIYLPVLNASPGVVMDGVLVFPRRHGVKDFTLPPAEGWVAQPWDGGGGWGGGVGSAMAPLPAGESGPWGPGTLMYNEGILFTPLEPQPGPEEVVLNFAVGGYEPFLDVYIRDGVTGEWIDGFVVHSEELLGDMDGDGEVTPADLLAWDLALSDPAAYAGQYPGLDPILRGDLDEDGALTPVDRELLEFAVFSAVETDAVDLYRCLADITRDGQVDVLDLLALLDQWGICPEDCQADLNGDEVVDVLDLLMLLDAWGPCPDEGPEIGACCFSLTCARIAENLCVASGGAYGGDGSVCDELCPASAVPCCFADSTCGIMPEGQCLNQGGVSRGPLGSCDECLTFPSPPVGACCFSEGTCDHLTSDACLTGGGAYRGDDSDCAEEVCRDCSLGGEFWLDLEPCDNDLNDPYNGGCNTDPPVFQQVCCGDTVMGTIWSIHDVGRDLDWRILNIEKPTVLNLSLTHSFGGAGLEGIVILASATCPTTIIDFAIGSSGVQLSRMLDPGDYFVIVTSEFAEGPANNAPCGSGLNDYTLDVMCEDVKGGLCNGHCGGQAPDGCWCDQACIDLGDCCGDHCQMCPETCCPWDVNGDGEVNVTDMNACLKQFGPCDPALPCPCDFNRDGDVNQIDLNILIANWGPCPQ